MKNRIISLILVLVLVFTLLPVYAIAEANAETAPEEDSGMTLEQSPDIQALVDQIKKLLNGGQDNEQLKARLQELLEGLTGDEFEELLKNLGVKDAEAFMEMLKGLLNNNGSIDPDLLKALLGMFIKDEELLNQLLNGLTQEQLQELLQKLLDGNFKLEDLKGLLTEENLQKLLDELMKNDSFKNLFGDIDINTLIEALRGLIGGDGEDNGFNSDIVAQLLQALLEKFGDGDLQKLLDKLNIEQLKKLIEDLLKNNGDIGDILGKLDKDKLLELFKQFIGDNETLKKLLEKLDSDQIADILKKLLEGGFDIKDLLKNLDAYTFLKFIAGLMGSELDVTGPNDVTVKEGESATFKVKVNTAGTYKYLWLEPDAVKSIDFGGIDLSGNKLEIAFKLLAALKKVSLSTTDTLTIAKAAASDNGRAFACMIYNIDLKSPTMYITNEAKLTVAAHEHTKVIDTPAVAATCTKDGCTEGSHCSECGEVLSKSEVIPATGHKLVYKVCSVCGYEVPFPFVDVSKTDWFYNDVKYVWQHDIMNGVSDTKFAPETPMTRAMFVTVLYRLEGSPDVTGMATPPFTDIGAKNFDWAYNAIVWAYNTGVTKGTSATTFAPGVAISRQEIVTMFYRYAGSPAVSGSPIFGDSSVISSWARNAVQWAKSFGVVNGYPNGNFGPVDATTRGQMAAMIHRYMQLTNVL